MNGTFYDLALYPLEKHALGQLRTELLSEARGHVLEIGFGTGLNLPHYPGKAEITALDPDPGMLKKARRRTGERARLLQADAEKLPFPDANFDTVVGTLVFCSIPHPERAMREAFRVLKPGGRLLLLEHVRKPGFIGRIQDAATPLWKHLAGGCHLNRDPGQYLSGLPHTTRRNCTLWGGLGRLLILEKP